MIRKIVSLFIVMILMFALGTTTVFADEKGMNYLYTRSCSSSLSISGLTATCKSSLRGYYGLTTKIEVTQTLQVRDGNQWRQAKTWTATYYSHNCDLENTRTVYSGNTYRVMSEFKVYAGSSYETVYSYSTTKTT